MKRRHLLQAVAAWIVASMPLPVAMAAENDRDRRLNVLLLTADDLHCESVGAFGGKVGDLTPNA